MPQMSAMDRHLNTIPDTFPYHVREEGNAFSTVKFFTPEEAVAYAKEKARTERRTMNVLCDERTWITFNRGQMVKRPWRVYYQGAPTVAYEHLMAVVGGI